MFGLMEITASLNEPIKLAIIPTVVLPLTVVGMILTSVATWVAALFGIQLKAEGPKRIFEVLMKPKVLLLALLSNLLVYGAISAGKYVLAGPYPLWWVHFQNSPARTTNLQYENTLTPTNSLTETSPKVASATISSVDLVWENNLKELIFASPQVTGNSLFAGTQNGRLIEVDLENGKVIRKFEIGKPVMTSPTFWQQKIYAGEGVHDTHHARLYSFDLKSGAFLKAFQTQGHIERSAVVAHIADRAVLLAPAGKDGLYAIDPVTMEKIWQAPVGHVDSHPLADSERVYVGTGLEMGYAETATKVFSLNIQTGAIVWEKYLPTSSWGIPAFWKDKICFGVGDVYKNTHYGQLTCYDRQTGQEYFAFNTTGALISQPTVTGDHLIVSDLYGKIYQFNLHTKSLDWTISVPTRNESYASVVLDSQDRLILPGIEGLYIYSRQNQNLLFTWKPTTKENAPWKGTFSNVVFFKDLWILADKEGVLRALRIK
ncbi:PQQ-binding-like beta-propeller repeat protein [Bdellovibrio svalbardensis]|uniref:PQQ-binding-like beta-propeller repeat protein n=1 Tax=Bdellovibrio svalbardensis TaxID=2972972 RepID=A0ABT6DHI6_9BACT|nr:PQQ-binding-like beta-propeller repeat protein [Bdellovibrio svalbardensis]MDG0816322.1 PQQ-binding-like beta-propeller repeat protein [Bdellovibrio svalbardensis]